MPSETLWRAFFIVCAITLLSACNNDSGVNEGAGSGNPVSFNSLLLPTFESPRCQNCHGFDTGNAVAQNHAAQGRSSDCSQCHTVPGWQAPFQSFSFTGLSGNAICTAIKNKFGGDLNALKDNLLNSVLAQWGIADGSTPFGGSTTKAFPGDLQLWANLVNQWIDSGANCE